MNLHKKENALASDDVLFNKKKSEENLNFWRMKNQSTCEVNSMFSLNAWMEWDKLDEIEPIHETPMRTNK